MVELGVATAGLFARGGPSSLSLLISPAILLGISGCLFLARRSDPGRVPRFAPVVSLAGAIAFSAVMIVSLFLVELPGLDHYMGAAFLVCFGMLTIVGLRLAGPTRTESGR